MKKMKILSASLYAAIQEAEEKTEDEINYEKWEEEEEEVKQWCIDNEEEYIVQPYRKFYNY